MSYRVRVVAHFNSLTTRVGSHVRFERPAQVMPNRRKLALDRTIWIDCPGRREADNLRAATESDRVGKSGDTGSQTDQPPSEERGAYQQGYARNGPGE